MDQLGSQLRPNPDINLDAALDLINSEDDSAGVLDHEEEEKVEGGKPGEVVANRRDQNNQKLLDLIRQAEPIAEKSAYNPQSLEEAAWRRKKVRQLQLNMAMIDDDDGECKDDEYNAEYQNNQNQERLQGYGAQIPVTCNCNVRFDLNPGPDGKGMFKYLIYDGYKPTNLLHSREYLEFLLRETISDATEAPRDVVRYMQQDILTKLPQRIRETDVLEFDQNFECGNLDQVYLKSDFEYDMLMKVDTNTRGNTYWFYFKVSGFMIGLTYKFNIMNFTRNLGYFYGNGMNICSRTEMEDEPPGEWSYNKCFNLNFQGAGSIVRGQRRVNVVDSDGEEKTETQKRYFGQLSFCHMFTEEQRGHTVSFAAAIPYGYSDMLKDLREARHFLMQDENSNFRYDEGKSQLIKKFIPKVNNYDQDGNNNQTQGQGEQALANISVKAEGPGSDTTALKNVIEMERENIRREGQLQLQNAQNRFEQQMRARQLALKLHLPRSNNFTINSGTLLYKQEVIGQSLCGLSIYQIVVTKRPEFSMRMKRKNVIYVESRLHAAETHGSLIMKYLMFDILKHPQKYDKLLHNNVIKMVPMLNPDGVVIGNARCSFAGLDLNRRWSDPSYSMHPEIFFLKTAMALTLRKHKRISIFCDLHGHNKHMNTFVYGCNKAPNEGLLSWTKTRLLPKIIASYEPIFHFQMCAFSQEKTKYNTARVVVWNEFRVLNSFTLETSMYGKEVAKTVVVKDDKGYEIQRQRTVVQQLTLEDFHSIGISLLKSFDKYTVLEVELEKEYMMTNGWLKKQRMNQLAGYSARDKLDIQREEKMKKERAERKKVMMLKRNQVILTTHVPGMPRDKELSSGAEDGDETAKAQAAVNAQEFAKYREQMQSAVAGGGASTAAQDRLLLLAPEPSPTKIKRQDSNRDQASEHKDRPSERLVAAGSTGKEPPSPKKRGEGAKGASAATPKRPPEEDHKIASSTSKATKKPGKGVDLTDGKDELRPERKEPTRNVSEPVSAAVLKKKKTLKKKPANTVEGSHQKRKELDSERELDPDFGWKAFFDDKELETAVEESKEPPKPKAAAAAGKYDESDSEPSCDNFGEEDLVKRFEVAMDKVEKEKQVQRAEAHKLAKMPKVPKPKPEPPKRPVKAAPKPKYKLHQRFDILRAQINTRIQLDAAKKDNRTAGKQPPNPKPVDQELGPPSRLGPIFVDNSLPDPRMNRADEAIKIDCLSQEASLQSREGNIGPVTAMPSLGTEPTPIPQGQDACLSPPRLEERQQPIDQPPQKELFGTLRKEVDRRRQLRPAANLPQLGDMPNARGGVEGMNQAAHFLQQSQSDTVNHDDWQSREALPLPLQPQHLGLPKDTVSRNRPVDSVNGKISPLMSSKEGGAKVTPLKLVQQSLSREKLPLGAGNMSVTNFTNSIAGSLERPRQQQAHKPGASAEGSPEQPFESTSFKPTTVMKHSHNRSLAGWHESAPTDPGKHEHKQKKPLMAVQGSYEQMSGQMNDLDRHLLAAKTDAIRNQANMSEAYLGPNPMAQMMDGTMTTRKKSIPGTITITGAGGKTASMPSSKMKRHNRYFSPNQQQNIETQFEDLTLPEIPQRREPPYKHQSSKAASMAERSLVSPERNHASNIRSRQQGLHKYSKSNVTLSTSRRPPHNI